MGHCHPEVNMHHYPLKIGVMRPEMRKDAEVYREG